MRFRFIFFLLLFQIIEARADILPLDDALRATYTACVGIDDQLADLKKMAGINTAVTAVGTVAGAGATAVGIVKANKDTEAAELEKLIEELRKLSGDGDDPTEQEKENFLQEFEQSYETALQNIENIKNDLDKLTKQSKHLGNWRTGLAAGSTATNVVGAIIAGTNKVDKDLQSQINDCLASIDTLRQSMMQARIDGADVSEANEIISACSEYNYVDVSKINNRAKGAMISSIVGSATGAVGTVTSAIANTDKTRDDNSDAGKQKEKNLNTAANVLSGATTAASATATVFNATQISAIKKVATVAEKCTGVLK